MDHSLLGWMDGCLFQGFQHEKTTYEPVREKKRYSILQSLLFLSNRTKKNEKTINKKRLIEWLQEEEEEELQEQ